MPLPAFAKNLLGLVPKAWIKPIAMNYIAGENNQQCIQRGMAVNAAGSRLTIDILGEHAPDNQAVDAVVDAYISIIQECHEASIDFDVSLKLSHLGIDRDVEYCKKALLRIVDVAEPLGIRVTLDMESTALTDAILEIYREFAGKRLLGTVIQAYLKRSMKDLEKLVETVGPANMHIRICKGIYSEPPDLVYSSDAAICENYRDLAEYLYDQEAYVCIATHDEKLLDHFSRLGWESERFEFQVLLGVPVKEKLEQLQKARYQTTVYLPYGPDWYAYSMRRMYENPRLIQYVISNFFK